MFTAVPLRRCYDWDIRRFAHVNHGMPTFGKPHVTSTEEGIVGDVDFDAVQAVAGAITPMPGGTGPMTIGCLLQNTMSAARMLGAIPAS